MVCLIPVAFANYNAPLLVLDARNVPKIPKHFRMGTTIDPNMRIAGGGQFSVMGLKKIREKLQVKRFTIIDLRQEPHGFLNGNAISWYAPQDAMNADKKPAQIDNEQLSLLLSLLGRQSVAVNKILQKAPNGKISAVKPVEFAVHQVWSEAELASQYHYRYHRLYVQDFHAPTDPMVDQFILIVKKIPPTNWIYVHCHAGVGRTTTFMAMFDMMRHAKHVSFEEIMRRQNEIGGKDLLTLPRTTSFKYEAAKERLAFLRQFYEYAKENHDDFKTSWSGWKSPL